MISVGETCIDTLLHIGVQLCNSLTPKLPCASPKRVDCSAFCEPVAELLQHMCLRTCIRWRVLVVETILVVTVEN